MTRVTISTSGAPTAVGHYSQAVKANGFVFTADQLGLNPATVSLWRETSPTRLGGP